MHLLKGVMIVGIVMVVVVVVVCLLVCNCSIVDMHVHVISR